MVLCAPDPPRSWSADIGDLAQEHALEAGRWVQSPSRYAGLLLPASALRQKGGAALVPPILRGSIRSIRSWVDLENRSAEHYLVVHIPCCHRRRRRLHTEMRSLKKFLVAMTMVLESHTTTYIFTFFIL